MIISVEAESRPLWRYNHKAANRLIVVIEITKAHIIADSDNLHSLIMLLGHRYQSFFV